MGKENVNEDKGAGTHPESIDISGIEQESMEAEKGAGKAAPPLGTILDNAKVEVGAMVFGYMSRSGIPPSLFDYVLSDITLKVKDMKADEYAKALKGEGADG